jgi:hypothetical protein
MPGIVLGEASSSTNPLLPFFYQDEGFLRDVFALRFEVYPSGSASTVATGTTDLIDDRFDTGCYAAVLDPQSESMSAGAYEIVWYYKPSSTSAELEASYSFEVLSNKYFRSSTKFKSYLGSDDNALDGYDLEVRQKALEAASKEVDRITGRFFFPKHMILHHSIRPESRQMWIDQPVIGVSQIILESESVVTGTLSEYELDMSSIRVFNRHIAGLLSPDDRDNPRIAFAVAESESAEAVELAIFPIGVKNVKVTGVFGYTDPDGSPFGEVPSPLQDVIRTLAFRKVVDPTGTDVATWMPGRVKKAKTRDQEIQFDTSMQQGSTEMTGDPRLDGILIDFSRPPHVGVAG